MREFTAKIAESREIAAISATFIDVYD